MQFPRRDHHYAGTPSPGAAVREVPPTSCTLLTKQARRVALLRGPVTLLIQRVTNRILMPVAVIQASRYERNSEVRSRMADWTCREPWCQYCAGLSLTASNQAALTHLGQSRAVCRILTMPALSGDSSSGDPSSHALSKESEICGSAQFS